MVTVMGLDLSTKSGVVVLDQTGAVLHATVATSPKATGLQRCSDIVSQILPALDAHRPAQVILEGYGFGNANTLVTLVEIGTVVRFFLRQRCYPILLVPPTVLKKFVCGSGAAKKDEMRLHVFKRWGFEHKSDDIVDAFALARFGLAGMACGGGLTQDQTALLKKVSVCT